MSEMTKFKLTTKAMTTLAVLTAMEIVLSRFLSISAWNIKIGFSFIPIVIAALLYGPAAAGIVAALGDLLGAMLFPIGPFFPGFTFTAFLTGAVFGLLLYKSRSLHSIAAAVLINQFVLGLLLNTLWISVLYGASFPALLATRVFQSILLSVIQVIVILGIVRIPAGIFKQVMA